MLRQLTKGWILGLCAIALFHMGTVLKKRDPIYDETLTSSISLKDKMEETKDGVKGAPSPSFKYYGGKANIATLPIETPKEEKSQMQNAIPNMGESIPEKLDTAGSKEIGGEWWDEDATGASKEDGELNKREKSDSQIKEETEAVKPEEGSSEAKEKKKDSDDWWAEEEPPKENEQDKIS